jgi:predicted SprT family Zn-dependent metalloprotease
MEKIIESKYNLELIPFYGLKEACGGDAFLKTDFTGIVIDGKQYTDARYANRLRFSLAHELGHYVLHKEYYRDINIKTVEDYKYYTTTIDERDWKALEWQANEFVSNPKTYLTLTKLL